MPIGTKVRLNSGGPEMTIIGRVPWKDDEVVCVWESADGTESAAFVPVTLTVI